MKDQVSGAKKVTVFLATVKDSVGELFQLNT